MLADTTRSLSPHEEASLLWRLRRQLLGNLWRQALANGRLRLAVVVVLSIVFWVTLFLLFADAFRFLNATIPLDVYQDVIGSVFGLFFVSLMTMLVVPCAESVSNSGDECTDIATATTVNQQARDHMTDLELRAKHEQDSRPR